MKIIQRLKAGLATKEGKLKAVIVITGVALLIMVLTVGALAITSTPKFCQSCHEMKPEYVTWNASAHSNVSCVDCHIEPGVGNFLTHKVKSFKELYNHFSGNVNYPIEISAPIKDEVCEKCHTENRIKTPTGDIKIPHDTHKKNDIPCVQCHSAVAHANVAEEGFTADGNWEKWRIATGKVYMKRDFVKFSMLKCIKCHTEEEGRGPKYEDCSACHNKLRKPDSHLTEGFLGEHGKAAMQDITQCEKCHQFTWKDKYPHQPGVNSVGLYTRQNEFCAQCHTKKRPAGHGEDWRLAHSIPAKTDRNGCLVCHDEGRPTGTSISTKTFCYQCHRSQIHSLIQNGHPRYPLGPNPRLVRDPCFKCHSEKSCVMCHYKP